MKRAATVLLLALVTLLGAEDQCPGQELKRLAYNNPGLVVDLGVGLWAWPLPMDYDGDGDLDLVVSCPDKPYNGTYFFENPGTGSKSEAMRSHDIPVARPNPISNANVSASHSRPNVHHRLVDCGPSHFSVNQKTREIRTAPVNTLTCRARRSPSRGSTNSRRMRP